MSVVEERDDVFSSSTSSSHSTLKPPPKSTSPFPSILKSTASPASTPNSKSKFKPKAPWRSPSSSTLSSRFGVGGFISPPSLTLGVATGVGEVEVSRVTAQPELSRGTSRRGVQERLGVMHDGRRSRRSSSSSGGTSASTSIGTGKQDTPPESFAPASSTTVNAPSSTKTTLASTTASTSTTRTTLDTTPPAGAAARGSTSGELITSQAPSPPDAELQRASSLSVAASSLDPERALHPPLIPSPLTSTSPSSVASPLTSTVTSTSASTSTSTKAPIPTSIPAKSSTSTSTSWFASFGRSRGRQAVATMPNANANASSLASKLAESVGEGAGIGKGKGKSVGEVEVEVEIGKDMDGAGEGTMDVYPPTISITEAFPAPQDINVDSAAAPQTLIQDATTSTPPVAIPLSAAAATISSTATATAAISSTPPMTTQVQTPPPTIQTIPITQTTQTTKTPASSPPAKKRWFYASRGSASGSSVSLAAPAASTNTSGNTSAGASTTALASTIAATTATTTRTSPSTIADTTAATTTPTANTLTVRENTTATTNAHDVHPESTPPTPAPTPTPAPSATDAASGSTACSPPVGGGGGGGGGGMFGLLLGRSSKVSGVASVSVPSVPVASLEGVGVPVGSVGGGAGGGVGGSGNGSTTVTANGTMTPGGSSSGISMPAGSTSDNVESTAGYVARSSTLTSTSSSAKKMKVSMGDENGVHVPEVVITNANSNAKMEVKKKKDTSTSASTNEDDDDEKKKKNSKDNKKQTVSSLTASTVGLSNNPATSVPLSSSGSKLGSSNGGLGEILNKHCDAPPPRPTPLSKSVGDAGGATAAAGGGATDDAHAHVDNDNGHASGDLKAGGGGDGASSDQAGSSESETCAAAVSEGGDGSGGDAAAAAAAAAGTSTATRLPEGKPSSSWWGYVGWGGGGGASAGDSGGGGNSGSGAGGNNGIGGAGGGGASGTANAHSHSQGAVEKAKSNAADIIKSKTEAEGVGGDDDVGVVGDRVLGKGMDEGEESPVRFGLVSGTRPVGNERERRGGEGRKDGLGEQASDGSQKNEGGKDVNVNENGNGNGNGNGKRGIGGDGSTTFDDRDLASRHRARNLKGAEDGNSGAAGDGAEEGGAGTGTGGEPARRGPGQGGEEEDAAVASGGGVIAWLSPWSWYLTGGATASSTPVTAGDEREATALGTTPVTGVGMDTLQVVAAGATSAIGSEAEADGSGSGGEADVNLDRDRSREDATPTATPTTADGASAQEGTAGDGAANPIEDSIRENRGVWASFFSSRALLVKAIGYGSESGGLREGRQGVKDEVKRDENGVEVMDIEESDEEGEGQGQGQEEGERGRALVRAKDDKKDGQNLSDVTKALIPQVKSTSKAEKKDGGKPEMKKETEPPTDKPAAPLTRDEGLKDKVTDSVPTTKPGKSTTVPPSPTGSITPKAKEKEVEEKQKGKIKSRSAPSTPKRNNSPTPSSSSLKKPSGPPPPPNLVLPTWEDVFHTAPRNVVPPPPPAPPLSRTNSVSKDQNEAQSTILGKTMKFVSGVLFSKDQHQQQHQQQQSGIGQGQSLGSTSQRRAGRGRGHPNTSSLSLTRTTSGLDIEVLLEQERQKRFERFGEELPKAWKVFEVGRNVNLGGGSPAPDHTSREGFGNISGLGNSTGVVRPATSRPSSMRSLSRSAAEPVPDVLRGCKRVVIIGVHGWFPGAVMRTVLGEPTGTSSKFANMMEQAVHEFEDAHDVRLEKVTKIPLEGEGTIQRRVDKLCSSLLANKEWMDDLYAADAIIIATHSQGSVVSTHLLDRLIADKHIKTSIDAVELSGGDTFPSAVGLTNFPERKAQRICCLALCGIHLGPLRYLNTSSLLQPYLQYFESTAARELFEFQNTESAVSKAYVQALRNVLHHGVKMVYVASLNDQVVPIYSGIFTAASHPMILRALYIDGDAYHSSDFLSNLLVLLLRLRNSGIPDGGLLSHLSEATAGSLSGIGHSTAYEESSTYSLAVRYLFEANDGAAPYPELQLEPFDAMNEQNDYEIPWSLRDVIADERVIHYFSKEVAQLRDAFRDWHPKTAILRDLKRKLQPIQRLPSSFSSHFSTSKL